MPQTLFKMAKNAMAQAHAPYSKYKVGAAIRTSDGRLYSGCNVENASFPEGWCAETTAIGHMIMDGGKVISEIAVICDVVDKITPCGGCRQRISEFATPDTLIHLCDQHGVVESISMGDLLPKSFKM